MYACLQFVQYLAVVPDRIEAACSFESCGGCRGKSMFTGKEGGSPFGRSQSSNFHFQGYASSLPNRRQYVSTDVIDSRRRYTLTFFCSNLLELRALDNF